MNDEIEQGMLTEKALPKTPWSSRGHPWKFLLFVFLLVAVVTTAVPVLDWARRPNGGTFTGYSYESVGDVFVYLNFIEQAKDGAILFQDRFTPEPHPGVLFHPLFLFLGKIAHWLQLTPLVVWHAARVVASALLLAVMWLYVTQGFRQRKHQYLQFGMLLLAGGFTLVTSQTSPILLMLYSPKSVLTLVTTLLVFWLFFRLMTEGKHAWYFVAIAVLSILQAFSEPYPLFLWVVVMTAYAFLTVLLDHQQRIRTIGVTLFAVLVVAAAEVLLAKQVFSDPILRGWSENANGIAWGWVLLFLYFGVLGVFATLGVLRLRGRILSDPWMRFLLVWFVAGLVAALSPYPYGYRITAVLQFPLAALATHGLVWLLALRKRHAWLLMPIMLLLGLSVSDNIHHFVLNFTGAYTWSGMRYLHADETSAVAWIREHTNTSDIFLTSPSWDTLFTEETNRRVYLTQGWQTLHVMERARQALDVFAGAYPADELSQFLQEQGIHYIVLSGYERINGVYRFHRVGGPAVNYDFLYAFHPESYPFLQQVYAEGSVAIYAMKPLVTHHADILP